MNDFVLQTKLHPPADHSTAINRPHLLTRLTLHPHTKLILLTAPAGYGKTTLITQWLNDFGFSIFDFRLNSQKPNPIQNRQSPIQNPHIAWLSLDEQDNTPSRFWRYVHAARQQLQELTAADLRFTHAETSAFLQQTMQLTLPAADIATLEKRTEGWAAGLQMAALSLRHNAVTVNQITGDDRYIVDYLLAEVLAQQPADIREFLLHTAVLRRLTPPLCQQLYPHTNAQTTLEQLARHNLFTLPLDNQRRWYRYHHLFAELLQNQLQQQNPDLVFWLHEQAAAWYLQHNTDDDRREALHHLLTAQAYPAACDLLDQHIDYWLWEQGELITVIHWLDQIPDAVLQTRPRLLIWKAAVLSFTAHIGRSRHCLTLISDQQTAEQWRGYISFIQSHNHLATGNPAVTVHYAQEAVEFLPDTADNLRSMALQNLGLALRFTDDAPAAERTFRQAVELAITSPNRISLFNAYIQLGDLSLELGNLKQAENYYRRVVTAAEDDPTLRYMLQVAFAHGAYGTVFYHRNQLDQAFDYVQKGLALSSHIPNAPLQFDAPILLSNLYAAQGN